MSEIWMLIAQSPEEFKGGAIWDIVVTIHGRLKAIGYALLVLFFVVGVMRTCGNFAEIKRPEQALKLFIRFAIAKGLISHGLELMMALFTIVQGVINRIVSVSGFTGATDTLLPQEMVDAIESCGFLNPYLSLCEQLIGNGTLGAKEKSLIDRCTANVYRYYQ